MEKVGTLLGNSPKNTLRHQITNEIDATGGWEDLPYHPLQGCPVCKGIGFVHPREGERIRWDKVIPCSYKGCLRDATEAYQRGAPFAKGHGVTAVEQIFDTFKLRTGTKQAYKYAKEFAEGKSEFVWLLIYGQPGNGKTHLCNAITQAVLDRGCEARMLPASDMFAEIKAGMDNKNTEEVTRKFKDIFVLVIDDLGVEYKSEWKDAIFDEIMTSRFASAKPTVVTTNMDITGLSQRLRSRFSDKRMSRMTHNSALDYRKER